MTITQILPYVEIFLAFIMVAAILLQQSGAGVGGAFGGGDGSTMYHTRRGFEKFLFYLTIVCAVLFSLTAVLLVIKR